MSTKKIEAKFNEYFAHWKIRLPPEDVAHRRRGRIAQAGWMIWYLFDADEKGEYLDFYASHRMTNDRHVRLYASGQVDESLPTFAIICLCSDDPVEQKRLRDEFYAHNRAVAEMLDAKGFGLQGDEPGSVVMNRFLQTGGLSDDA